MCLIEAAPKRVSKRSRYSNSAAESGAIAPVSSTSSIVNGTSGSTMVTTDCRATDAINASSSKACSSSRAAGFAGRLSVFALIAAMPALSGEM